MNVNEITRLILEAAYKVHSALGPGLLESSYQACLAYEIRKRGLHVETEVPLPLVYEEIRLDCGYRIDMLVENCVIIELKVVEVLNDVHLAQVLTYLKFSHKSVGLLINYNVKSLKDGIRRVVL
jgi:GxxExxY protein